jgi:hypothetical protein
VDQLAGRSEFTVRQTYGFESSNFTLYLKTSCVEELGLLRRGLEETD